jgi:hypothetical protein
MPFSTVQCVFIVEHCFRTQSCEAVEHAYQAHVPDDAVPNNGVSLRRISGNMLKQVIMSTTGWRTLFNMCCNYVIKP